MTVIYDSSTGQINSNVLPPSGVAAGTYGSTSTVPVLTVDTTGRITSASNYQRMYTFTTTGLASGASYNLPVSSFASGPGNFLISALLYDPAANFYYGNSVAVFGTQFLSLVSGNGYTFNQLFYTNVYASVYLVGTSPTVYYIQFTNNSGHSALTLTINVSII